MSPFLHGDILNFLKLKHYFIFKIANASPYFAHYLLYPDVNICMISFIFMNSLKLTSLKFHLLLIISSGLNSFPKVHVLEPLEGELCQEFYALMIDWFWLQKGLRLWVWYLIFFHIWLSLPFCHERYTKKAFNKDNNLILDFRTKGQIHFYSL